MPDLNFRTQAVRDELTRLAVAWAKKGVDGFRLDAIRHLIETGPGKGQSGSEENHVYLRELNRALRAANPNIALVGEVWSTTPDIAPYYGTTGDDELQMLFNFPLAGALVNGAWSGDTTNILEQLAESQRAYPAGAVDAPFLTNHDQLRVASALSKDRKRLGQAAAMLLTLPGAPFIYYGEELGLANGPGNADEWKRTPMLWDSSANAGFTTGKPWHETVPAQVAPSAAEQSGDATSLLSRYRGLVRARHASPALGRGSFEALDPGTPKVLAFLRRDGDELVLVTHNLASGPQTVLVKAPGRDAEPLFVDPKCALERAGDQWKVTLPGLSSAVYRLR
jgi:glycosidase